MHRSRALALLLALLSSALASGEPTLDIEVGWENLYRVGRWNPVFITLSNDVPRAGALEIYAPHDQRYSLRFLEPITIDQTPRTLPFYLPLTYNLSDTTATLRGFGPPMAAPFAQDSTARRTGGDPQAVGLESIFAGISGAGGADRGFLRNLQFANSRCEAGYLPPSRLPAAAVGYDALDLLILHRPDFTRISDVQQQAILQWVRGGGALVLWPGAEPIPATSPLVDALPCRIGESRMAGIDISAIRSAGLSDRFARLPARDLSPLPDSAEVKLFLGADLAAWRARRGFGQILLVPTDLSQLQFNDARSTEAFWRRLLAGVIELPPRTEDLPLPPGAPAGARPYTMPPASAAYQMEYMATGQALDWLADVPGAGRFGFSWLAIVLAALMIVVGPVDWFVLKMLGRQPWTWITTSGWIALVTLGAMFLGHVMRSGDLHFRALSLIDEADGQHIATTDLAAIYSPRTAEYRVKQDDESWWRPASENYGWGGGTISVTDIECFQDADGSRIGDAMHPGAIRINIWNLRFLRGNSFTPAPATVDAKLRRKGDRLEGTLTNRGAVPLKEIVFRVKGGTARPTDAIAPDATVTLSLPIIPVPSDPQQEWRYWHRPGQPGPDAQSLAPTGLARLTGRREQRLDALVDSGNYAALYASIDAPPTLIDLPDPTAKRQHRAAIRALLRLE